MNIAIVQFPGSNCDSDCFYVIDKIMKETAVYVWHEEVSLPSADAVILPGGFAHGDYLRTGAMAKFSPILKDVKRFAKEGGLILGICNGFQILTEAGLLPGAFLPNENQHFVCDSVHLRVENTETPFTQQYGQAEVIRMPVAHGAGRYFIDSVTLKDLEVHQQVLFRYVSPEGVVSPQSNVNGSVSSIAGVCNREKNVMGLMPHPERCCESMLGGSDGLKLFRSMNLQGVSS